jgi:hypothetical protein
MNTRLCGPHSYSENFDERSLDPTGTQNPRSSSPQPTHYTDYAISQTFYVTNAKFMANKIRNINNFFKAI